MATLLGSIALSRLCQWCGTTYRHRSCPSCGISPARLPSRSGGQSLLDDAIQPIVDPADMEIAAASAAVHLTDEARTNALREAGTWVNRFSGAPRLTEQEAGGWAMRMAMQESAPAPVPPHLKSRFLRVYLTHGLLQDQPKQVTRAPQNALDINGWQNVKHYRMGPDQALGECQVFTYFPVVQRGPRSDEDGLRSSTLVPQGGPISETFLSNPDFGPRCRMWFAGALFAYGVGPWSGEPDKVQWSLDEMTLLATRSPEGGNWQVWVGVPKGHPYFGFDPDKCPASCRRWDCRHSLQERTGLPIQCRGLGEDGKEVLGVAHVTQRDKTEERWWFGLDLDGRRPKQGAGESAVPYRDLSAARLLAESLAHGCAELTDAPILTSIEQREVVRGERPLTGVVPIPRVREARIPRNSRRL